MTKNEFSTLHEEIKKIGATVSSVKASMATKEDISRIEKDISKIDKQVMTIEQTMVTKKELKSSELRLVKRINKELRSLYDAIGKYFTHNDQRVNRLERHAGLSPLQ